MISLSIFVFVAFLMLFLGGTVFVHDPRNRANRLFLLWIVLALAWMISNYLENVLMLPSEWRELFLRVDFASAIIAAGIILAFTMVFVRREVSVRKLAIFMAPAIILSFLSFSSWLLARVFFAETGEIQFKEGPIFAVYGLVLLAYFGFSCVLMIRGRRHATPAMRAQMTSVAAGLLAFTIVSTTVNLFLQNVLSVEWFRIGVYSMIFFVIGVAWAIARHQFLRVRFVIVEILLLGVLATLVTRTILSRDLKEGIVNIVTFVVLVVLGFAMIRSFLTEDRQRVELEHLAEELTTKNVELKAMDQSKSEFLSIASHELRTPMSVIKGYLSLIMEGAYGPVSKPMRDRVEQIYSMNERLVHMIGNLLNLSRIEKGKIEYTCSRIQVEPMLHQVMEELSYKGAERSIKLELAHVDGELPYVCADADKLREVFSNLIDNAIKYSQNGTVVVSTRKEPAGDFVTISVKDNGIGMTEDEAKKLFTKYYRTENAKKTTTSGIGLGLYICFSFVKDMGGKLWIEQTVAGHGTTFAVRIPTTPQGECAKIQMQE